uniref:Uncharacterized protein n=1 Tax=Arundo donax TaxID=35708 RepID=A0A0A9F214_ARUDO
MMIASLLRGKPEGCQHSGQLLSGSHPGISVLEKHLKCTYIQWHHLLYFFSPF